MRQVFVRKLGAAAHHRFGEVAFGEARELGRLHDTTVAQNRGTVAEVENLAKAVRDVDDGDAFAAKAPEDGKEAVGLSLRECRGWFVEDEHCRIVRQRLGDLDQLPLGKRQRAERGLGCDVEGHAIERGFAALSHRGGVEKPRPSRFAAEDDVLGDAEIGEKAQLLVDGRDAEFDRLPRRGDGDGNARKPDLARVRREHARNNVDHGGLPAPFWPITALELAMAHRERRIVKREDAGEALGDRRQFESGGRCFRHSDTP